MWSRVFGSNLFRFFNSLLAILFLFTTASYAVDTLYWLGTGGGGDWNLTSNNWTLTSGGSPNTQWVNGDDANLPAYATRSNITVDSGGISVENITVNNTTALGTSYVLSGGPITLTGTTPTITSSSTGIWDGVEIDSVISGSVGLQKDGLGFLDLYGANNYTGVTNLIGGYVTLFNDSALGSSAGGAADGTVVQSGAGMFCWVNRTIAGEYLTLNGFGDGTNTAIRVGGNQRLTWNGPVTLGSNTGILTDNGSTYTFGSTIDGSGAGANFTLNLGGDLTNMSYFNGNITLGSGSLIKNRGGTMQLTGSGNSWNTLTINNGNVQIGDGGATGSLPPAATYNISGDPTYGNGQLVFNSSNNFSITSDIASAGVTTYSAGVATYPSGSSPGGIYLAGTNTGTVTLSGNNSSFSTPYIVDGGALVFSGANAVGIPLYIGIGGGSNNGVVKLDSGSGVNMWVSAPFSLAGRSSADNPHLQSVSGINVLIGNISLMEGGNMYVIQSDVGAAESLNIAGYVQNNSGSGFGSARNLVLQGAGVGIVSGSITAGITAIPGDPNGGTNPAPINVVKTGAGTWTLSGVNTYNGATVVNAGTLTIGTTGSITASPQIMINQTGIFDVSAFASFQLQSAQQLAGLGAVTGSVSDAAGVRRSPRAISIFPPASIRRGI